MIIRESPDNDLILVGQTDHSKLVGQLAAHWGNDAFAVPSPYTSVVRGATFHDFGWLRYETSPLFDQATGELYDFAHPPSLEEMLEDYQWTSDWLMEQDHFASLLVNRHRTGLWRNRYGVISHPPHPYFPAMPAPVEQFLVDNEARQSQELSQVDAREFETAYRLLQVWDILGLYFCCQDPYEDYIEPVPYSPDDGDGEGCRLQLTALSSRKVRFDPYPFDEPSVRIQLTSRRLKRSNWSTIEQFQTAYFKAPLEMLQFELVP